MENSMQIKNPMLRKFQTAVNKYTSALLRYEFVLHTNYKSIITNSLSAVLSDRNIGVLDEIPEDANPNDYMEVAKFESFINSMVEEQIKSYIDLGKALLVEIAKDKYFLDLINDLYDTRLLLLDEIDESLAQDKLRAIAYIKDVLRWIMEIIGSTGFDDVPIFHNIDTSSSNIYDELRTELLSIDSSSNSELELVKNIIYLCWWFYDAFKTKCEDYGYNTDEIYKSMHIIDLEPQQSNPQEQFYKVLTAEAKEIYNRAIEFGYMDGEYNWKLGTSLLAYLTELIYLKDATDIYPNTDLCKLFNVTGLKQLREGYISNKNGKPRGFEKIDKLFD